MAANPFERLAARMDAVTASRLGRDATINGKVMTAVESHFLPEMGALGGDGLSLVVFDKDYRARTGDIVIYNNNEYSVTRHVKFNGKPQIWLE
ncbi:DNA breaking-rejoining protein [Pantoea sp.]|uniref:DNA breaking-rejoining protein n=1 Tax=Pantoea sp. TaxID=69393 RepID=UPI0028ADA841|nr:DNA breaking-rejoining protein [Pantoea sp.]